MRKLTYKDAGVDIDKANRLVRDYRKYALSTKTAGVLGNVGSFGGLFRFPSHRYRDPILVSSTDGVGTKLKIAFLADKHDTIGIDLVAMSCNDILCSGARGLFFLDYVATGHVSPCVLRDVVKGIADGCKLAGYALVGGETAEMPGIYAKGEYDVAGFGVGVVERDRVIDGRTTRAGDVIIGLESSGLHSNGFSLARKALGERELKRLARKLLIPTRIYTSCVLELIKRVDVKGVAHITGGAFYDKVPRIVPKGLAADIGSWSWEVPEMFRYIQKKGKIDTREMYRTFNMGIGMIVIVDKVFADKACRTLERAGCACHLIGRIVRSTGGTVIRP